MIKCTNPNIGKLITRYEFNLLLEDEKKIFETHLLECDACSEDLYGMLPVMETMKENPDIIIDTLKENISKWEEKSLLRRFTKFITDLVYTSSASITSMFLEHRLVAISAVTFGVILLFLIVLWKIDFLRKYSPQTVPELVQHKIETIDSSKIEQLGDSSGILEPKQPLEKETPQIRNETNLASLAVIEHERYSTLLSIKEEKKLDPIEKLFYDGMKYYEEKNYQQAIVTLAQLYQTNSNFSEAQFYLGMCYLLLKDSDRGIKHLQNATESNNNTIKEKSYWYLGNAYLLRNEREQALQEFHMVVQLNGEHKKKAEDISRKLMTY